MRLDTGGVFRSAIFLLASSPVVDLDSILRMPKDPD